MRIELLIIDPQNDFCDPKGALYVSGADNDMKNLAAFVNKNRMKLDDIHATLDSHHFVDIAHPVFWTNSKNEHPAPFTIISEDEVINGIWRTTNPAHMKRGKEYVRTLASNGRYPLCIWPPHCLIGSWGYGVFPEIFDSLLAWEKDFAMVDYVTKGSNFWSEHYSAVQADVPDPEDPGTQLNQVLIQTLQNADMILLAGEARSHCLANTVRDIANNFGEENIKKMYLLEDCTSDVTGFEQMGNDFIKEMSSRGMNITSTKNILV